ncbi:MFS transporter [uncultured Shewanella sp.]|uniref:MFS transporter n=1 Tax=uncultured Shewanella sp. TaxID=173975 RepID=UPI00262D69D0|nr:MFS transporter [uncultured Shewanella sp.]
MTRRLELILLVTLAMIPFGIVSAIYNASVSDIAGALGLSADDTSWFNIVFILTQLLTLPLASWLSYRVGAKALLILGTTLGFFSSLVLGFSDNVEMHFVAWAVIGIAASAMLVAVQVLVLRNLSLKDIAIAEGCMMLMTTLLPMGIYPWLIAELAENGLWQFSFAAQSTLYLLILAWLWLRPLDYIDTTQAVKFNPLQAISMSAAITAFTLVLMRGQYYNWFDSPEFTQFTLLTAALILLCVSVIAKQTGCGEFIRSDVLSSFKNKVSMYNAALAGFAVLGTSMLISVYLGSVLHYSHSEQGWLQLPAFGSMLVGLLISIWICNHPRLKPDAVVPIGVLMILLSSVSLSGSSVSSGASDMLPALILRGLGVGLLNVTVSISILSSFKKEHIPQGVSYFYLFRTLGGIVGMALFSRMMSVESSSTMSVLGENFNQMNDSFIQYQVAMTQVLNQGMLEATPERVANLLSSQLQLQTAAIAGGNNFMWFIVSLFVLAPILIIGKKLATKSANQQPKT